MKTFADPGPDAQAFFEEQGYAVFTPRFSTEECARLGSALDDLLAGYARDQGMPISEYLSVISQWRDLWRSSPAYDQVLRDGRLWSLAATLMRRKGARLLHDHIIAKPHGESATVPWHQDYPYWPVDTAAGLSCWSPLDDVDAQGGCLEVVAGSHLNGERPPVDFINDDNSQLDRHPDRVLLPVPAGSVVVLHSLTWHRTGPNCSTGRRRAYITLWLPPDARYAPAHADWHPTNEHITVAPGQILNDDWFPCFGETDTGERPTPSPHQGRAAQEPLSMFSASQTIADQVREILRQAGYAGNLRGGIGALLASEEARRTVLTYCLTSGVITEAQADELHGVLRRLQQCADAYRLYRARNVYNEAYVRWWQVAGARWAAQADARP